MKTKKIEKGEDEKEETKEEDKSRGGKIEKGRSDGLENKEEKLKNIICES